MNDAGSRAGLDDMPRSDNAPGDGRADDYDVVGGIRSYLIGFLIAVVLTVVSFVISGTSLVWGPSIPIALFVLAIAQMGVHLVFFLHITTGSESTNNTLALAFGVLIVFLVVGGSFWIMGHLNHMMPSMDRIMQMQR